jgi:FtsP/CotA-like multicopper oxidase with cupredoxin domain
VKEVPWSFHRDLSVPAMMFSYSGSVPGPMIQARYGEPLVVRFNNMMPKNHIGVGVPETATHLHNMHSPAESDGFPGDFVTPGNYRDQHYPMIRAGYNNSPATNGDYRESLGTPWYHDHRFNFTSQNVYKGLFGYFNAFDELDTGNETDPSSSALLLPSGQFDIMLGFQDDGNLLEAPLPVDNVLIGVANRLDVVIDFSNYSDGDEIYLVDRGEQLSGRGPTYNIMDPGVPVLKFKVHGVVKAADPSVVPRRRSRVKHVGRRVVYCDGYWKNRRR